MRQTQRWTTQRRMGSPSTRPRLRPCSCRIGERNPRKRCGSGTSPVQHRWLGVWIDSQMTPKEHHAVRTKKARSAMQCIRRLTG